MSPFIMGENCMFLFQQYAKIAYDVICKYAKIAFL